jgi:ubiquinone/menaquinone biosynthesis C-methylase UbiE
MMTEDEQALYRRFAHLYDRIYHWKDYGAEAETVHVLLLGAGVREGARVVEAACGAGNYLGR